jgi:DNA-binding SARP family transcriptional activator/Tfp pilus assembly protein PilF
MLRLTTLGTVGLAARDGPASPHPILCRPKRLALLAYLAVGRPGSLVFRDTLLALLWSENDDDRARRSLRQTLYHLRRDLGEAVLVGGPVAVGTDPDHLWCDAVAFERAIGEDRLEEALELYRGDFMAGFHGGGGLEYERWLEETRSRLRNKAEAAASVLIQRAEAAGDHDAAIRHARWLVEILPCDERTGRALIRLLAESGDRPAALAAHQALAARLDRELELEPDDETSALVSAVRAGTIQRARAEPSGGAGSASPAARDAYLRGRCQFVRMTPAGAAEAIRQFQEAIRLDPGYAPAHAALAYAACLLARTGRIPPREAYAQARQRAEQALALDSGNAEAHITLGICAIVLDHDWPLAERHLTRGLERAPDLPESHWSFSYFLCVTGRHPEARQAARRARELDPIAPTIWLNEVLVLAMTGRPREALVSAHEFAAFHRESSASAFALGVAREVTGDHDGAAGSFARALELGGGPHSTAARAHNLACAGRIDEARRLLDELRAIRDRYVPPTSLARIHAALGEADEAFHFLDRAVDARDDWLLLMDGWPRFEGIRADPRFAALRRRLGLPEPTAGAPAEPNDAATWLFRRRADLDLQVPCEACA